jgi:putative ABC transport system permease protein
MKLLLNALRLALTAVSRNKTRSLLTILGILIGVAAVVSVTTLASGASAKVGGTIDSFGVNVLFVSPQPTQTSGAKGKATGRLTENDAKALVREGASIGYAVPFLSTQVQLVYRENNASTMAAGSTLAYFPVRKFEIEKGDKWTESDEILKAKVIVLGATVVEKLFGAEDPIGRTVRIGVHPFRVIGVFKKRGTSPFGEDQDDRILMPVGTFRGRIMHTAPGRVDMLIVSAKTEDTVKRAEEQVRAILAQRHRIPEGGDLDFQVNSQAEMRAMQQGISSALTALLLGVALVSLFVGGIGVMNIMLVTVTERTREIGIRMSIGARSRDIMLQFLIEAIVLTLLGGLLGAVLGIGGTMIVGRLLDWDASPSMWSILAALGTSSVVGLLFGFMPARRASLLDPIDALRTD